MARSVAVTTTFTVLDEGREHGLDALVDGDRIALTPASVQATLGWKWTPNGLCQGDVCVPLRGFESSLHTQGLDLTALATVLNRPLAVEPTARIAYLGPAASDRAARMDGLTAPALTLADLDGRPHHLHDFRGRKVFLLAFASW